MSKIRDVILKEMQKKGLTIYKVSKMVEGKIPRRTLYDFLSGTKDTVTETAWILMEALGLTITTTSKKKRRQKMNEKTISKGR